MKLVIGKGVLFSTLIYHPSHISMNITWYRISFLEFNLSENIFTSHTATSKTARNINGSGKFECNTLILLTQSINWNSEFSFRNGGPHAWNSSLLTATKTIVCANKVCTYCHYLLMGNQLKLFARSIINTQSKSTGLGALVCFSITRSH